MAKLTKAARARIPSREFAGPGRSFPVEDKAHAVAAERLAPRAERAGHISHAQEQHIERRAKAVLHDGMVVTEHHRGAKRKG